MISFRQHVVSLVAVFLALAVGIVLGGGPFADTSAETSSAPSSADEAPVAGGDSDGDGDGDEEGGDPDAAQPADGETSYAERFAAEAGVRLYAAGLAAAPVALLAMPGADTDLIRSLSDQVKAAGGRVTGRFVVQESLLAADQVASVDDLGADLAAQVTATAPVAGVDAGGPTYERLGGLLGAAISTTERAAVPPDATSLAVRQALSDAGLVASPSAPVADAPLVLVVLAADADLSTDDATTQAALLAGVSGAATGVVVLGDEASAETGTLAALRSATPAGVLATVDDAATALGPVSATLALIGAYAGRGGAFGAASAEGALPLG